MSGSNLFTGTLDLLILRSLTGGPRHGYDVGRWIRQTGGDALSVEEGVLYPGLKRLEGRGWVTSRWGLSDTGRRARFYELTKAGRGHLDAEVNRWTEHSQAVFRVLNAELES